jgi:hypothetical protein
MISDNNISPGTRDWQTRRQGQLPTKQYWTAEEVETARSAQRKGCRISGGSIMSERAERLRRALIEVEREINYGYPTRAAMVAKQALDEDQRQSTVSRPNLCGGGE